MKLTWPQARIVSTAGLDGPALGVEPHDGIGLGQPCLSEEMWRALDILDASRSALHSGSQHRIVDDLHTLDTASLYHIFIR